MTIVERGSRYLWAGKVSHLTAKNTLQAIVRQLRRFAPRLHSITSDCGNEFARYERIAELLQADYYFADPGCPWQRGSIENANGILRRFFPKGSDLSTLTHRHLKRLVDDLNNRPRECLGWRTPHQILFQP